MYDFAELWGSVEALRRAVAAGYVKPGRDEQATLALAAEIDRLRKDAERYRWLRAVTAEGDTVLERSTAADFDSAIDAWMAASPAVGAA